MSKYMKVSQVQAFLNEYAQDNFSEHTNWSDAYNLFSDLLDFIFLADTVNLVKCKLCKRRSKNATYGYHRCTKRDFEVTDDFFCRDGEEEGEEE